MRTPDVGTSPVSKRLKHGYRLHAVFNCFLQQIINGTNDGCSARKIAKGYRYRRWLGLYRLCLRRVLARDERLLAEPLRQCGRDILKRRRTASATGAPREISAARTLAASLGSATI